MAATLTSEMDNTDKIGFFYQDTLQQGVTILLPDVNTSVYRFAPVDEKTIAYGLGAIKGTGEAAINNIVAARKQGLFRDTVDFCRRVDKRIVNRRTIEALIKAGAFDKLSDHRASMLATLDSALSSADQQARSANQNSLFGEDDTDRIIIAKVADVPRWRLREQLAYEKASLGMYLGGHPYQEFAAELANFIKVKLGDLTPQFVGKASNAGNTTRRGVPVVLAGVVAGVRIQQTRRGRMAVVMLDDGSAKIEMTVYNEEYERSRPWLKEDELIVVRGKASLDEYSGGVRISGEEVFDLASARSQFAQQLTLRCSGKADVTQLKQIFMPYRDGKCPVRIYYRNEMAACQLRLGEGWGVTLHDDLLSDLRNTLQNENVQVVYQS
jgi:DNA polymerase-3 subunit alpha